MTMRKEVILWQNQELIAVAIEVVIVVVVKAAAVDKVPAGPAKPVSLPVAVEPTLRQNASNWLVLIAVSLLPVNTSANK